MARRLLPIACVVPLALLASSQKAAAAEATRWAPAGITSQQFESHPAFDPQTGDLYFVRSTPQFSGWRILVSHCGPQGWTEPQPPSFAGPGLEADPYFTADGKSLYFISTRASGSTKSKDLDLWRVDRGADGRWGEPTRLPEPLSSPGAEWFPRPAPDGWLYFGSDRPGGLGGNDIWRARPDAQGRWTAENLGPAINSAANEYEPLPSNDGDRLLVMSDSGLSIAKRAGAGWSKSVKLGPEVTVNGSEIGALWSPSGKTLLFARDTGAPDSGELFVWHEQGNEPWPPECPARKP